jgi:hypothetical protein
MDRTTAPPEVRSSGSRAPDHSERKPYHRPELASYGDVFAVTHGGPLGPVDFQEGSRPVA